MTEQIEKQYPIAVDITGSGGGGKGGGASTRSAQEAPNTLRSSASVRIVEVISEGVIDGIVGGGQGIFFNDTPILQADGSTWNFQRVSAQLRTGLPSQPYMQGFSAAESEIIVGVPVTISGGPVVKTTSSSTIDAVKVTIQLPQGLYQQNTSNGDLTGNWVCFNIETKLTSSGTWQNSTGQYYSLPPATTVYPGVFINGKTTSPYERQYHIFRPSGSGSWDIRVTRASPDDTSSAMHSLMNFARITEIVEVKDTSTEYDNTAVVGLAVDSQSVGNSIPTRSYLVQGINVQVPSNYNGYTHVYSGTWDGTFHTQWTNNPAWVLYDLLTNDRYGMGEFIQPSMINKYDFYDAAVYNDGLVPDGHGTGGTEYRYTFNGVINARDDAFRILQMVAGAMRATLVQYNGLIGLIQDRPASVVKLISKANVIDGLFNYKSSGLFERHTAFNVTFNDPTNRYLQKVVTIDATTQSGAFGAQLVAAQAKYGYNPIDIAAYGCTSEAQALRHGRWAVDTEINQTEIVQFKMSLNGFDLLPGEIIEIYDEDYTGTVGAGRIVDAFGLLVTIDRQVTLTTGSWLQVTLSDGTIQTHLIFETSGTTNTFHLTTPLTGTVLAGADYIIQTTAAPRQFKILAIKQEAENIIALECVYHDPNKFSRVENGVNIIAPIFSNVAIRVTSAPISLAFKESSVNVDNTIKRSLLVSWMPPTTGVATYYSMQYRVNTGTWTTITNIHTPAYELTNIIAGAYEFNVYAHSSFGNQSPALSGTYSVLTDVNGVSPLSAPTTLVEQNGGGTTFNNVDLNFKWTNPSGNSGIYTATLRDFIIKIYAAGGSTPLRVLYANAVAAGSTQSASYTWAMNNADTNNVPNRSIKVEVYCRDTAGNVSAPVTTTFSNPICSLPTSVNVVGGLQTTRLTYSLPSDIDFAGIMVWGSTTSGFTPSSANLLYDGTDSYIAFNALSDATTYYYKIGSYDTFGKSASGTGMNVSTQYSATTASGAGVPKGATNPLTGTEGDVFFNTTDGQLYRYHSGVWTTAVPAVNVTGTLTDAQLAAISAAKVTGQIISTQITDGAISTPKLAAGSVTSATIAADTITAGNIAANAIGTSELAAGAVVASKISAGTITSNEIAANTIVAGNIAAATISSSQIAAGTIVASNIAAGSITGDRLAANTVTATNIDSRNLTIKDAAGTVILSSGVPLAATNITPASGWLNSNIAISGGAITGIGTGAGTVVDNSLVTATGIGAVKTDASNAPATILNSNVSISSSGVLSGAGGGTVTVAGLDSTIVRSANPITSSNISTYIANAAIGTAQIGSLNASVITAGTITTDKIVVGAVSTKASLTISSYSLGGAGVQSIATTAQYIGSYFSSGTPIKVLGRLHLTVYSNTLIDSVGVYFTLRTDTATSGAGQIYYHSSWHKVTLQSANYYTISTDIPIVLMFSKSGPVDLYMTAGCSFFNAAAGYVYPSSSLLTIQPDIIMEENKV